MRASQDRGLRGRAGDIARLSASAPALLTAPGALDAPYGGEDLLVEVLDAHQRVVARSSALGGRLVAAQPLVRRAIARARTGFDHVSLSGQPLRLFVAPLPAGSGPAAGGAVIVASSTEQITRTADRVHTLILLTAALAVALGAAIAAALTGRALAPLSRLTIAARRIVTTADSARRLPAADGGEVGELTDTLNAMLAALEAARESERRFLADASHELRTPVTALLGNAEYLARHGSDPSALADLVADAERVARLVDDLLVYERQQRPIAAQTPIALDRIARAAAAAAGPQVAVDAPDPVVVLGDEQSLRRAVDNLIANAQIHGRPPVAVTVAAVAGRAQLRVADAGPGLTPDEADQAFERFWRGATAPGRPGSGLGLAIVRATARAHGGDVRVARATFTIELPLAPADEIVRDSSQSTRTVQDVPTTRSVP